MYLAERFVTSSDLNQIEKYADRLFRKVGIDVEFTRHFVDRVNDERNKKQISVAELVRIFNKAYQKFGKAIARLGPDAEAVMKDMRTDINMPFVLKLMKNGMLELVAKTIMRKKNFKTSNKTFSVEAKRIPRKSGQPANSKKHSDLYTDENPKGTIHGLKFATVEDAEKSVRKIESSGKSHAHKIQAAIAMEQRARVAKKIGAAAVYRKYINKMKKVTKMKRLKEVIEYDKTNVSLVQEQSSGKNFLGRINSHRSLSNSTSSSISRYVRRSSRNTVGNLYNN
jgi:hypothetical protein